MAKRILVVDDETDFSELVQFRLRHLNYEVSAAANGTEALDKARTEMPDVVLLDLMLPDLDGLTICEILKRQPATCKMPIIMITAITSEATRCAAHIAGACALLGKPLEFDRLQEQLEVIFAAQSSQEVKAA